jgi:acetyl-CoA C-acetyltransferase
MLPYGNLNINNGYISDSVRTPRGGKANGSLAAVSPVQLLTFAQRLKERNNEHRLVEDLIVGCVTVGDQGGNVAKVAAQCSNYGDTYQQFLKQVLRIGSGGR